MVFTDKIQRAIRFAVKTHEVYQKQTRKGKNIPYITHPLAVGLILARAGADEEVIVAGILHDVIEDSAPHKKVTEAMIVERFGQTVATLVVSVTEEDKSLSWEERKTQALEHIKDFSHKSVLVKSADLISNVAEILEDYEHDGEVIFDRFNALRAKVIDNYLRVMTALTERWPQSPLSDDLGILAQKLRRLEV